MKLILKWGTRIALLQMIAGIAGYFVMWHLVGDATGPRAELIPLLVGCIAAAGAALIVGTYGYIRFGLPSARLFAERLSEGDIAADLGLTAAIASLAFWLGTVAQAFAEEPGMRLIVGLVAALLTSAALGLAWLVAKKSPYIFLPHEPEWARFVAALPLVGPILGRLAQNYLLPPAHTTLR